MGSGSSRILSTAEPCHGRNRQASEASSSLHSPPPEIYYSPEGPQDGWPNAGSSGSHQSRSQISPSSVSTSRHASGIHEFSVSKEKQGNAIFFSNDANSIVDGFLPFPTGCDNERMVTQTPLDDHPINPPTCSYSSCTDVRPIMAGGDYLDTKIEGAGNQFDDDDLSVASISSYRQSGDRMHRKCKNIIVPNQSPDNIGNFERRQALSSSSGIVGVTRENTMEIVGDDSCEFVPLVHDENNDHQGAAYPPVFDVESLTTNSALEAIDPASTLLVQENTAESSSIIDGISERDGLVASSLLFRENASSIHGGSSGREARRNSGRRFWDALTRVASHRRSISPITIVAIEEIDEHGSSGRWDIQQWRAGSDGDQAADNGAFSLRRSLDFEERRRRVREQVCALQRLSRGLEGLPNHSRNCLAGQHLGGYCSCMGSSQAEDLMTRATISRIVMLAEALFEVLDEIQRQSAALTRSAMIPLSSLPAPDSVVDTFPVRIHKKMDDVVKAGEEVSQCYICLVEYEEDDQIRVLPCHHDYHKKCVDKWLKEVHRVCPLCRGDVCEAT